MNVRIWNQYRCVRIFKSNSFFTNDVVVLHRESWNDWLIKEQNSTVPVWKEIFNNIQWSAPIYFTLHLRLLLESMSKAMLKKSFVKWTMHFNYKTTTSMWNDSAWSWTWSIITRITQHTHLSDSEKLLFEHISEL